MLRKFTSLLVLIVLISSNMGLAFANVEPGMAMVDKVVSVEKFFNGAQTTGALVQRVSKLEKDVWGSEGTGSLLNRVDKLYSYSLVTSNSGPSFLIKLNAAEWSLTHAVTVQPAKARMENLERTILGDVSPGSLDDRLNQLLKLAYVSGKPVVANVTLNKDTLLKVKLLTALNTHTSKSGDAVAFEVNDDIYVDGSLIIPKGVQGIGKVTKVEEAKNFGRDAKIEISFDQVGAMDGSTIRTILGDKARLENKSLVTAAGASMAGALVFGPIGILGGAFIHGKDVDIPVGAEIYIQIKDTVNLYGI